MPIEPDTPDANSSNSHPASSRPEKTAKGRQQTPTHPPSKPLQIFLLLALAVTGVAYVVDRWTQMTSEEAQAQRPSKLRRLVAHQSKFLAETALGFQAETNKLYADAVAHFRRALLHEVNAEGRLNLGNALLKQGNPDMAFSQFKEALRLDPNMGAIYTDWGQALTLQGKLDEAVQLYQDALRHNSNFAQVHYNFARVLEQQQQTAQAAQRAADRANQPQAAARGAAEAQLYGADAVKHYAAAENAGLNTPDFLFDYGASLNKQGKFPQAEACLAKAVAQKPSLGAAQFQLALAEDRQGKYADAIAHYEATLATIPDDPATLNNLALVYGTATNQEARSSKMAVSLATRACDATANQNPRYLDTLARAYAADADFFQAVAWEDKAVRRATQLGDHELVREFEPRFNLFLQHKPE
jgi:tetratricopeptide (TPR) repeat protein